MIKAFLIIFGCLAFGTLVIELTAIEFPASIIGLLTLFTLLQTGVVKMADIKVVGEGLLDNLALLTVVPCVGIMQYLDKLAVDGWIIVISAALSTMLVMAVTGYLHQWLRRKS